MYFSFIWIEKYSEQSDSLFTIFKCFCNIFLTSCKGWWIRRFRQWLYEKNLSLESSKGRKLQMYCWKPTLIYQTSNSRHFKLTTTRFWNSQTSYSVSFHIYVFRTVVLGLLFILSDHILYCAKCDGGLTRKHFI